MFFDIPLTWLNIDSSYQRTESFDIKRVYKIVENFKEEYCDTIKVFYREKEGKYYVANGMHRTMAKILLGEPTIIAEVIEGKNSTYEAEVLAFIEQACNDKSPSAYDRYKSLLSIEDPDCKAIAEISKKYHLSVAPSTKRYEKQVLSCVSYIMVIVKKYGKEHLDDLLGFATQIGWDEIGGGLSYDNLYLLSILIRRIETDYPLYKEKILSALVDKMENITPLLLRGLSITKYDRFPIKAAMSKYLKDITKEVVSEF